MQAVQGLVLRRTYGKQVVQINPYEGPELRRFLADHGVDSTVVRVNGTSSLVLEMDEDIDADAVQDILDQWQ